MATDAKNSQDLTEELPAEENFIEQAEYIDRDKFISLTAEHPYAAEIMKKLMGGGAKLLIGPRGCGKSTLLKLIYGLYDLEEGQIFWNQTEVLGPKFHLIPGMPFMKYLAQVFYLMPFIIVS